MEVLSMNWWDVLSGNVSMSDWWNNVSQSNEEGGNPIYAGTMDQGNENAPNYQLTPWDYADEIDTEISPSIPSTEDLTDNNQGMGKHLMGNAFYEGFQKLGKSLNNPYIYEYFGDKRGSNR